MPVTNPSTPTVQVSVPVPTPVVPQKGRQPVSFGPPPAVQSPAQQSTAPVPTVPQQPVPGPRAIIFPWSPGPKRMSRLSSKVVRHHVLPKKVVMVRG